MTPFETMQKHYQQRVLAAREWKKKGGKVVGYFCDNIPEEIILAAGFFPFRLSGDPQGSTEAAVEHTEGNQEGFTLSMLNLLLTGKYDFLDFLVIPNSRDSIFQLYNLLVGMKESNPALKLPELYFLDNLGSKSYISGLYNRDRVLEFRKRLEKWAGKKISNRSLSRAIAIGNQNKILLKKVADLRAADPPRISGVEALQIIGSSMFMLKEEHNKVLAKFLEGAERLSARDSVRLFVEGSPLDNLQLYKIIESCNATIVAEDNCWGNRYSDVPVDTSLDPLEAIVDRYHHKSPCPRMFPLSQRVAYCVKSALEAKAQGVIFNVLEFDEDQVWEIPDEIKALEEKGIPTLYLKKQPYLLSQPERLKTIIGEFVKAI